MVESKQENIASMIEAQRIKSILSHYSSQGLG